MSILDVLKQDHDAVKALMETIDATTDSASVATHVARLSELVLAHSQAEEDTFYAQLEEFDETEALAEHGADEHQAVMTMLNGLATGDVDTPAWRAGFGEMKAALLHHVGEEEGKLFKKAKGLLQEAELERLGRGFENERARLLEKSSPVRKTA